VNVDRENVVLAGFPREVAHVRQRQNEELASRVRKEEIGLFVRVVVLHADRNSAVVRTHNVEILEEKQTLDMTCAPDICNLRERRESFCKSGGWFGAISLADVRQKRETRVPPGKCSCFR